MKTVKILALCLAGVFGFYSCGNDDKDEKKEEANKVYLIKSIKSIWNEDGSQSQTNFSYENGKIVKVVDVWSDGETVWRSYSYPSATTINCKVNNEEEVIDVVITIDASENVIVKSEATGYDDETFSYLDGNIKKYSDGSNNYTFTWSEGNLISSKLVDDDNHEFTTAITYSDIKNNTNLDFFLWFDSGSEMFTSQFIKSVSNNLPSSIKDSGISTIATTLDDKGRPSKMVYDGYTYTFEYYD